MEFRAQNFHYCITEVSSVQQKNSQNIINSLFGLIAAHVWSSVTGFQSIGGTVSGTEEQVKDLN